MEEQRRKTFDNKGFTLVETIVVIALIVMLALVSTLSIVGYTASVRFRRQNEYAQSIFVAAQSAMTHYKATGTLESLASDVTENGILLTSGMIVSEDISSFSGRLYAISKGEGEIDENSLIARLLGDYVYDKSILSAAIVIELDPNDGVIYSVLYSDVAKAFGYGNVHGETVSVSDRTESVRRTNATGFYSAETLSSIAPGSLGKPVISRLELVNSDTLRLRWTLSDRYRSIMNVLTYTIMVYDAEDTLLMSFAVNGDDKILAKNDAYNGIECDVSLFGEDGKSTGTRTETFIAYAQNDEFQLILDAVDISGTATSFTRFGFDAERIYVKMQASGTSYKASVWKNSVIESPLFADFSDKTGRRVMTVRNARHLFNIRYSEESNEGAEYVQSANITWGGANGIIAAGAVYSGLSPVTDLGTAFPSIPSLGENSVYITKNAGVASKKYSISDIKIVGTDDAGLFGINNGKISYLTLTNASVTGTNRVGAVCGTNKGELADVTVGGNITGVENVGGAIGLDAVSLTGDNFAYLRVTSSANVSGERYIGGIAGSSGELSPYPVVFEGCLNTGKITILLPESIEQEPFNCAGGIIGKNYKAVIRNCISVTSYSSIDALKTVPLIGSAVGGIVGFNCADGVISGCETGNDVLSGYVAGKKYVGGIIGYQEIADGGTELDGSDCVNRSHVIGVEYVGGIVGTAEEGITLKNWRNEGVICASEHYAGGIAGYNGGVIDSCVTSVGTGAAAASELMDFVSERCAESLYCGGITGRNDGRIISAEGTRVSCIVYGKSYVGGIAGYNTESSELSGYSLTGGNISGETFVGGLAGLNCESGLFSGPLVSMPNLVSGTYFTGGTVGANVSVITNDISASFTTDNFLGSVDGGNSAFTGGFVGYMKLLPAGESVYSYSAALLPAENETTTDFVARITALDGTVPDSAHVINIVPPTEGVAICRLASVKGGVYVGGLIGYAAHGTKMNITGYTNYTAIYASETISDGVDFYSYSSGIIGLCGENTVISNCSSGSGASVTVAGKYTGMLCEVNEGIVRDCAASSAGSVRTSHMGGIVGLNAVSGRIENCSLVGTVTGNDIVGGLAAVNEGDISGSTATLSGAVNAVSTAGGAAGINKGTVRGIIAEHLSVLCSGSNAGCVSGESSGAITDCSSDSGCSVSALSAAGGIVGTQTGVDSLTGNSVSAASVSGNRGGAGGIVGIITATGTVSVTNCENSGMVTAKSGSSGGIVSEISANVTVSGCASNGSVSSDKGLCSGIAAINNGVISVCTVGADTKVVIRGSGNIGGIAAINNNRIENTTVDNAEIGDSREATASSFVGGITGTNSTGAKIINGAVGVSVRTSVFSYFTGSTLGGICGKNEGSVEGKDGMTGINASVVFGGSYANLYKGCTGNMGGLAGENSGDISDYRFTGVLSANDGEQYAFGGIVGVNNVDSTVSGCVLSGTVTQSGTEKVATGGIAGINKAGASITDCTISEGSVTAYNGYTGGIVGRNYGDVLNCVADGGSATIIATLGDIAGIVGRNEQTGLLTACETGASWTVTANIPKNLNAGADDTTAGIIGYNVSDLELSGLINRATVTKTKNNSNSVGGIIGRNENQTSSNWKLTNCINYGRVEGIMRVGGIVGQIKYLGGTIEGCENYGTIYAGSMPGGGIVAFLYNMSKDAVLDINNCINRGAVRASSYAAGIVGQINGSIGNLTVRISGCVNVGSFTGGNSEGGILGSTEDKNNKVTIDKCRNYGFGSTGNFGGITASILSRVKVTNCFGIANTTYPLTGNTPYNGSVTASNVSSSYYFGNVGSSATDTTYIYTIESDNANVITNQNGNIYMSKEIVTDGDYASRSAQKVTKVDTINEIDVFDYPITVVFSRKTQLTTMNIAWYSNRTYTFRVKYRVDTNYEYLCAENGTVMVFTGDGAIPATEDTETEYDLTGIPETDSIIIEIYGINELNEFNELKPSNNPWVTISEMSFSGVLINPPEGEDSDALPYKLVFDEEEDGTYTAKNIIDGTEIKGIPYVTTSVSDSVRLYNDIDPKIITYYNTKLFEEYPPAPTDIKITDNGGGYLISWTYDSSVEKYVATVTVNESGLDYSFTKTISSSSSFIWEFDDEALYGKTATVTISAIGTGTGDPNSNSAQVLIAAPLPTPKVYAELTGTSNDACFVFVLENLGDYEGINCKVFASLNGKNYTEINMKTGLSATVGYSGDWGSANFSCYASPNNTDYGKSKTYSAQTQVGGATNLAAKTTADAVFNGFGGVSGTDFNYSIKITSKKQGVFSHSELLVEDEVFGYVSVTNALSRLPTEETSISVSLSGLPEWVASKADGTGYIARVIPWHTQNESVRFYHYIAKNVTKDDFLSFIDAVESTTDSTYTLKPGYVAEYAGVNENEETLYNIYYSVLLANPEVYTVQILTSQSVMPDMAPAPVIEDYVTDNGYAVFEWDKGIDYADALYSVTITGTLPTDGLTSVIYSTAATSEKQLRMPDSTWNFSKIKLEVQRLGTEINGATITRSSYTFREFVVGAKLTVIAAPTVALYNADKDNLVYEISWNESNDSDEFNATAGYTVFVRIKNNPSVCVAKLVEGAGTVSTTMDLESYGLFNGGDELEIFIVANAKKDDEGIYSTDYSDSEDGVIYLLTLPPRMDIPDTGLVTLSKQYDLASPITSEEFENEGITAIIETTRTENGYYLIEALLYKEQITDLEALDITVDIPVRRWTEATMHGSLAAATYSFGGLPAEYAGYWLYIRMRCVSGNAISSIWSDYAEFRLPAILLEEPELTGSRPPSGDVHVRTFVIADGSDYTETITSEIDAVSFNTQRFAKHYEITVTNEFGAPLTATVTMNESLTGIEAVHVGSTQIYDENGVYTLGRKPLSVLRDLTYIDILSSACTLTSEATANGVNFTLRLPDIKNPYLDADSNYLYLLFTRAVTVRAVPDEADADRYVASVSEPFMPDHTEDARKWLRIRHAIVEGLELSENTESKTDWNYDLSWRNYVPVEQGAEAYLSGFEITVSDAMQYPTRIYRQSVTGSPALLEIPTDTFDMGGVERSFAPGETVYIYVVAKATEGAAYADSLCGRYFTVTLPLLPPELSDITLSPAYTEPVTAEELAAISISTDSIYNIEYDAYITLPNLSKVTFSNAALELSEEYAGLTLNVRARCVLDALVSEWTDYATFILPELEEETP